MRALVGPIAVLVVTKSIDLASSLLRELDSEIFRPRVRADLDPGAPGDDTSCDVLVLDRDTAPSDAWRRMQRASHTSVLLLGGDPSDLVQAIEAGADDVVLRPERIHELAARVRALARRRQPVVGEPGETVGELVMDRAAHEVVVRGERRGLPHKQFELLDLLVSNPGRVMTRGRIIEHLWGNWPPEQPNTLDVQVRRLRQAIEADPHQPRLIVTVRGIGYRYDPPAPF